LPRLPNLTPSIFAALFTASVQRLCVPVPGFDIACVLCLFEAIIVLRRDFKFAAYLGGVVVVVDVEAVCVCVCVC
jgi:hypothetical protein